MGNPREIKNLLTYLQSWFSRYFDHKAGSQDILFTRLVLEIFYSQGWFPRHFIHKVGSRDILFTRLVLEIFYSQGWLARHFVHKAGSRDILFTRLVLEIFYSHGWFSRHFIHKVDSRDILFTLRKHAHAIFRCGKNDNFRSILLNIFLIFAQNIDCGYTLEPPQ